jgi:hypothetical protein
MAIQTAFQKAILVEDTDNPGKMKPARVNVFPGDVELLGQTEAEKHQYGFNNKDIHPYSPPFNYNENQDLS